MYVQVAGIADQEGTSSYQRPVAGPSQWEITARLTMLWPYWGRLVILAVAKGTSRFDAEDFASWTLLRVAASSKFEEGREAGPWPYLAATLANVMSDEHRQLVREHAIRHDARLIPRPRRFEEEVVDVEVATSTLRRLLRVEGAQTASMIVHHVANGTTWDELGRAFGMSASAARSRVGRALGRLRDRTRSDRHRAPVRP